MAAGANRQEERAGISRYVRQAPVRARWTSSRSAAFDF